MYAIRSYYARVVSVDLSRPAIEAAKRNWEHNLDFPAVQKAHHQGIVGDAFQVLSRITSYNVCYTKLLRPDGFLSVLVSIIFWVISAVVIVIALRKVNQELGERDVPLMGILAAAIFAGQMLNRNNFV